MQTNCKAWHIGLVGYGEVGRILAEDLRAQGVTVRAYDLKLGAGGALPNSSDLLGRGRTRR